MRGNGRTTCELSRTCNVDRVVHREACCHDGVDDRDAAHDKGYESYLYEVLTDPK